MTDLAWLGVTLLIVCVLGVWYQPLAETDHAMPAYTVANDYSGKGLGTVWNYTGNRGSFVGTFQLSE